MQKYVIEREMPGAGELAADELRAISEKSNGIIKDLGAGIQWVHSYVADNKIFCVYNAESVELIEEHARCGGFPVTAIRRVATVIDPTTPAS